MTDTDLKPCPFCGGKPILNHLGAEDNGFYISCDDCEVQQIAIHSHWGAITKWNARNEGGTQ